MDWRALARHRETKEWAVLVVTTVLVYVILTQFFRGEGTSPGKYLVGLTIIIAIYALLSLGLSVEMGYAGLPNFGHVAFMGIGAYTLVIFHRRNVDTLGPAMEGATVGGALFVALLAALGAILVYVPLLLAARLLPVAPRTRTLVALVPALLAALGIALWAFPMDARAASNAVAVLGILLGMVLAAVGALALGFTALRLREDYLAIVTLGMSQILLLFALNEQWLTNGSLGFFTVPSPVSDWARGTLWFRDLARDNDLLPVSLAYAMVGVLAVVLAFVMLEALARSPWGRVLKAIREDEDVASALGKNVLWYKLQALMMGSALAALAGVLFIWLLGSIVPTHFLAQITFTTFAMLVLGGIGNHKGAILGAVIIWGINEVGGSLTVLDRYGIQWAGPMQNIFIGLVLILVVVFRPQGAVGNKEELALGK